MSREETAVKQSIGFMLGPIDFYPRKPVALVSRVFSRFFSAWHEDLFQGYLRQFGIEPSKKINELSAGMKVKLGVALALSHEAKLIILDEPTSGLDPVARDELLSILQEIVKDGEHSVLFSTHITSDLDKCADYIIFIQDGRLLASETKDALLSKHVLVSGKNAALTDELKAKLIGCKTNAFGWTALALREQLGDALKQFDSASPNLEDIMVYYDKGEKEK
jgi:ABC-2 type transport system ATP-binding protein